MAESLVFTSQNRASFCSKGDFSFVYCDLFHHISYYHDLEFPKFIHSRLIENWDNTIFLDLSVVLLYAHPLLKDKFWMGIAFMWFKNMMKSGEAVNTT